MDEIPAHYRVDLEIIRSTADQILRDLNLPEFNFFLSGDNNQAFDELNTQLITVLENRFVNDKTSLQALLYRVDISEREYVKILPGKNQGVFCEQLSNMIIRREFKKVLIRKYYSEINKGEH